MGKVIAGMIAVGLGVVLTLAVIDASKRASLELGEACEKHIHCKSGSCLVFGAKSMCGQMCAQGCADGEECLPLSEEHKGASDLADVTGEIFFCFPTKLADELGFKREPVVADAGRPETPVVEPAADKPAKATKPVSKPRKKKRVKRSKKPKGKFSNRHLLH